MENEQGSTIVNAIMFVLRPSYWLLKFLKVAVLGMILHFLLRLEFFVWNYSQLKTIPINDLFLAFLWGIRFDLGAILAVLSPLLLLSIALPTSKAGRLWTRRFILLYFLVLQIPLLLVNAADIEFINFVGRRSTWDNLYLLFEAQGKMGALVETYSVLVILSITQTVAYAGCLFYIFKENPARNDDIPGASRRLNEVAMYFVGLVIMVIGIRGGFQKKPMNLGSAQIFPHGILNAMVLNSSFAVLKTMGTAPLQVPQYYTIESDLLNQLRSPNESQIIDSDLKLPANTNVMILILESFALEYTGEVNGGGPYTPFLDELSRKSLFFTNAFANSRRSIEGVPAILASIPALMDEPFLTSSYVSNEIPGFGKIFSGQGYDTAFFHGGMNGTMHFDSFATQAGFAHYYGANEYPNQGDYDGTWGIFDEPFLQFVAQKINQQQQQQPKRPFAVSIFTLSSHHPYTIPEKYKGIFPSGELEILPAIAYTDLSLRKFFASIEKEPWFQNTLFVLTADHALMHFRESYKNELGDYRVPLLFYHPGKKWPNQINRTRPAQHIDILPSIADLLDIPNQKRNYLAHSLFRDDANAGVSLFIEGKYLQIGQKNYLRWLSDTEEATLLWPNQKPVSQLEPNYRDDHQRLLQQIRAARQYFNEGMSQNRLLRHY